MHSAFTYASYATLALINVVISYGLLVFLANNLTKDDYALYGVLTTFMSLVLIIANFGHKEAVYKLTAERRFIELQKAISSFITWSLVFVGFSLLTLLIDFTAGIAALSFCAVMYLTILSSYYRGRSKYYLDAFAQPLYRSVWLAIGVGISFFVTALSTVHVFISACLGALLTFFFLGGYNTSLSMVKKVIPFTWPWKNSTLVNFLMIEFATIAFLKVDVLLLRYFNVEQFLVADYFFSIQIFEAVVMLLTPIGYFFFNRVARELGRTEIANHCATSHGEKGAALIIKYITVLVLIAALGQLTWYVAGRWILSTMFASYIGSFNLIHLLMFTLFPLVANIILSNFMILKNRERSYMAICFVGLGVSSIMNLLCIPTWDVYGAILSRFVTELTMVMLLAMYLIRMKLIK